LSRKHYLFISWLVQKTLRRRDNVFWTSQEMKR
jgi:hypothetical protein